MSKTRHLLIIAGAFVALSCRSLPASSGSASADYLVARVVHVGEPNPWQLSEPGYQQRVVVELCHRFGNLNSNDRLVLIVLLNPWPRSPLVEYGDGGAYLDEKVVSVGTLLRVRTSTTDIRPCEPEVSFRSPLDPLFREPDELLASVRNCIEVSDHDVSLSATYPDANQ